MLRIRRRGYNVGVGKSRRAGKDSMVPCMDFEYGFDGAEYGF
jgi:hypothetical protein